MLNIAKSKEIQRVAATKHIAGLISVADGYINTNEHAQIGADLRARLSKKAKPGDKVWFALVSSAGKYIFYFVGNEAKILRKLNKAKDNS